MSIQRVLRIPRAAALLAGLLAPLPVASAPPEAQRPPSPRLVITLAIDGLSQPRLAAYRPFLTGGLRRLLDEGTVFERANYRHLGTETCPGHASLSTGETPAIHGIVGNEWSERAAPGATAASVYCVDPVTPQQQGVGPWRLTAPTVADVLRERSPGSVVVSIAGKDRTAIMLAGRRQDHHAYWFQRRSGTFSSSDYYAQAAEREPRVVRLVQQFNETSGGPAIRRRSARWEPLDPALFEKARATSGGDPLPGETIASFQDPRFGVGFPHDARGAKDFSFAFFSPQVDELTLQLALRIATDDALGIGRDATPDLLLVGLSAHDSVSHLYGNESEEAFDTLVRLDRALGAWLQAIEALVGRENLLVALSADHGFQRVPELAQGGRLFVPFAAIHYPAPHAVETLNAALRLSLCLADDAAPIQSIDSWTATYSKPVDGWTVGRGGCFVRGKARAFGVPIPAQQFEDALAAAVLQHFRTSVRGVLFASRRASWPETADSAPARNAFFPGRTGDVLLLPASRSILYGDPVRGSSHGSDQPEDSHVPLIFWGGGIAAGFVAAEASPYDLAPTLAERLRIPFTPRTGRPLTLR